MLKIPPHAFSALAKSQAVRSLSVSLFRMTEGSTPPLQHDDDGTDIVLPRDFREEE